MCFSAKAPEIPDPPAPRRDPEELGTGVREAERRRAMAKKGKEKTLLGSSLAPANVSKATLLSGGS